MNSIFPRNQSDCAEGFITSFCSIQVPRSVDLLDPLRNREIPATKTFPGHQALFSLSSGLHMHAVYSVFLLHLSSYTTCKGALTYSLSLPTAITLMIRTCVEMKAHVLMLFSWNCPLALSKILPSACMPKRGNEFHGTRWIKVACWMLSMR